MAASLFIIFADLIAAQNCTIDAEFDPDHGGSSVTVGAHRKTGDTVTTSCPQYYHVVRVGGAPVGDYTTRTHSEPLGCNDTGSWVSRMVCART